MFDLRVRVFDRTGSLTTALDDRVDKFVADMNRAAVEAAKIATKTTRTGFRRKREIIPVRPGRWSTGGKMRNSLEWTARNGRVVFNAAKADREAPHWIIQEIGTNERAVVRRGGKPNPRGRPRKGASHVKTIKSQKGRRISGGLVFASGGVYTPPGQMRGQQLHWASKVRGVPMRTAADPRGQAAAIRIQNEIRGQHFVQKGGQEGFRAYSTGARAAARRAFEKKGGRP